MNTHANQITSSGRTVTIKTEKRDGGWWYYQIDNEGWSPSGYAEEKDAITMAKANN